MSPVWTSFCLEVTLPLVEVTAGSSAATGAAEGGLAERSSEISVLRSFFSLRGVVGIW